MQIASMGASTLSYKDFDPAFIASETEARIAAIEKGFIYAPIIIRSSSISIPELNGLSKCI